MKRWLLIVALGWLARPRHFSRGEGYGDRDYDYVQFEFAGYGWQIDCWPTDAVPK